jgi:hypothetical protein
MGPPISDLELGAFYPLLSFFDGPSSSGKSDLLPIFLGFEN